MIKYLLHCWKNRKKRILFKAGTEWVVDKLLEDYTPAEITEAIDNDTRTDFCAGAVHYLKQLEIPKLYVVLEESDEFNKFIIKEYDSKEQAITYFNKTIPWSDKVILYTVIHKQELER